MRGFELRNMKVSIESDVHPIYEDLVSRSTKDAEDKPFTTMKDVFLVSACLGAKYNQYQDLRKSRDIFPVEFFDRKFDIPILLALAYHKTKDLETLTCQVSFHYKPI